MDAAPMRVFVSHSSDDGAFCEEMVAALRGAGADAWYMDAQIPHSLPSTGSVTDEVQRQVYNRPVFIVLLSPAAFGSVNVRKECIWAHDLETLQPDRALLPVTVKQIRPDNFNEEWLFLLPYRRIEAPGFRPFPPAEAIHRTLLALGLAKKLPPEARDLVDRAGRLLDQGQYDAAATLAQQARDMALDHHELWMLCGRIKLEQGKSITDTQQRMAKVRVALANFKQAEKLNPQVSAVFRAKAEALRIQGHDNEAVQALAQADRLDATLG